jgi:hypothetical protein
MVGQLAAAAEHTFGLNRGGRDRPAQDRRQRAAQEYGVSRERFRKYHERVVIEQVAEEIMELCQPAASQAGNATVQPELAREIRIEGRCGSARFPVTVHVEPVELMRNVDVVVAPTNVYLEMPQPYKASVSAALRRAAAWRGPDGAFTTDEVADELRGWVSRHGRPGMPVAEGTVAATSAGALSEQGIRRIYHAAVVTPRPGTNDYDVRPTAITQAVQPVRRHSGFRLRRPGARFLAPVRFHTLSRGHGPATRLVTIRAKSGRVLASKPRSRGPPASRRS